MSWSGFIVQRGPVTPPAVSSRVGLVACQTRSSQSKSQSKTSYQRRGRTGGSWFRSYRMHCLSAEALRDGVSLDLADVRGVLLWGGAPYVEQSLQFRTGRDGDATGELNYGGIRHADEGPYLVLVTPWSSTNNRDDLAAVSRVQAAVALLRLALGPNVAVDHLGDLRFHPPSSEMQASSPPIVHPGWFGPPDISEGSIAFVDDLGSGLEQLEDGLRNRVELSLQWAFRASGVHGADSFLMHWLMLETLAMPDSQSVTS